MRLRTRLLAGSAAIVLVLLIAGVASTLVVRAYLFNQVDSQLESVAPGAGAVITRLATASDAGRDRFQTAFSEYYIGRLTPSGQLVTYVTPNGDPDLLPDIGTAPHAPSPFTTTTTSGTTTRVRVLEVRLNDGSHAVFALSLANTEAAIRRLVLTEALAALAVIAVLALVMFWMIRLGLRPIVRMTESADAITAGDTEHRVEVVDDGTEAARLGAALNAMIDTTQATEARLRHFVADASHELRTPLTTLRGYTELYAAGGFAERAELDDAMRRIGQEATRMSRIVDDLLLLARLDEGSAATPERVDVGSVLRDVASDASVVQPSRPVTVSCDVPLTVLIDRDHLVQAVAALTTNVLRHTDESTPLVLRAAPNSGRARVEIIDAGPGIPAEELPRIFDRFHRIDSTRSRASGGTGLGLAIVASIVTSNGGTYGVVSELGRGSTFWFELPLVAGGGSTLP